MTGPAFLLFCSIFTLTDTCADDRLEWSPSPRAAFYRVYVFDFVLLTFVPAWETTELSIEIGCHESMFLTVIAFDNLGRHSHIQKILYWPRDVGRRMECEVGR